MDLSTLSPTQSASNASTQAFSSLTENFDTFLTLLTTQLRNQDPLEPLDTEQFTQQLVQFAGVEQSIQTNANLETLISLQTSSDRAAALDLIGRSVTIATDQAALEENGANWEIALEENAPVRLSVLDENGAIVFAENRLLAAGANEFRWDGVQDRGGRAAPGAYRLSLTSPDGSTSIEDALVTTRSRVDAVRFEDDAARLETALGVVDLSQIRRAETAR